MTTPDLKPVPPIANESERLAALESYQILDTPEEAVFDDFTHLAAKACGVPISLISLLDNNRQWFKSKVGLDVCETPREIAFCSYALAKPNETLIVENATEDPRFANNLLVTNEPHIRFYAGAPLVTPAGHPLGTLCVIDREPRALTEDQLDTLQRLARQVVAQLEARRNLLLLKETAEVLTQQRNENQLILDHVPAFVYYKDTKGRILRANRALAESLNLDLKDIEGRKSSEVFPTYSDDYYQHDLEVIESGQPKLGIIKQFETANAERRWIKTDKIPIENEQGMVEKLLVFATDITTLKTTEESLRESKKLISEANAKLENLYQIQSEELSATKLRYEDLYHNAPDMFISVDPDSRTVLECNNTLLKELGYSRDEVIGHLVYNIIHPSSEQLARSTTQEFINSGKISNREIALIKKDGSPLEVSLSISAVRNDQGEIIASRGVCRDITEEKRLREEANQHLDQLAHLSRLATMNEMATGIAHELNQPLFAIKNYAKGAQRRLPTLIKDQQALTELLNEITSETDRAADLILALRRYVKSSEIKESRSKPADLVHRVIKILAPQLKQHKVKVSANAPEQLPTISCDEVQIEQVLINLILNAAEAIAEAQSEQREIKVIVEPQQNDRLRIAVVDQGPGLSSADASRIFDAFYTTKASGMGMGLAICRTIVEAHNGTIQAQPNATAGLTMSIELPAQN